MLVLLCPTWHSRQHPLWWEGHFWDTLMSSFCVVLPPCKGSPASEELSLPQKLLTTTWRFVHKGREVVFSASSQCPCGAYLEESRLCLHPAWNGGVKSPLFGLNWLFCHFVCWIPLSSGCRIIGAGLWQSYNSPCSQRRDVLLWFTGIIPRWAHTQIMSQVPSGLLLESCPHVPSQWRYSTLLNGCGDWLIPSLQCTGISIITVLCATLCILVWSYFALCRSTLLPSLPAHVLEWWTLGCSGAIKGHKSTCSKRFCCFLFQTWISKLMDPLSFVFFFSPPHYFPAADHNRCQDMQYPLLWPWNHKRP